MTTSIAKELFEQFQRLEAKLVGPQAEPYAFHEGEPWNSTLAKLPRTCRLWKAFARFDAARGAFEQHRDLLQSWKREMRAVGERLMAADRDPAAVGVERLERDTLRQLTLERLLERQAQPHKDLKAIAEREEEAWGRLWQEYQQVLTEEQRMLRAEFAGSGGMDVRRAASTDVVQRRKRFEAAQGVPA